jgi:hypothetical protein
MMVAATPLLSLIVITGSYFALTSLTNRMSGGDHVDPRIQSPDVIGSAPVASVGSLAAQSSQFASDPSYGLHTTGAEQLAPSINIGHSLSHTIQSRSAHMQETSERLVREMFGNVDVSRRDGVEGFISNYQGQSQRSSTTESDRVLQGIAQSVVNDSSRYKEFSNADASALNGAVALGLMAGGSGGQVRDALQNVQGAVDGERESWAKRIDHLARREEGHSVELARAIIHDEQQGARSSLSRALGEQHGTRWSEAVVAAESAQRSYDEAAALGQSMDLRQNISSLAYGQVAETTGTTQELLNMVTQHGLNRDAVDRIAGVLVRRGWSPSKEHAFGAAAAIVLNEGGADSAMDLIRYSAKHFGTLQGELGSHDRNASVAKSQDGQSFASVTDEVKGHVMSDVPDPAGVSERIDGGLEHYGKPGSTSLSERGNAAVQQYFDGQLKQDQTLADRGMAELSRVAAVEQGNAADSTWQDTRSLLRYLQEQRLFHQIMSPLGESVVHSLSTAANRVHSRYEEVLAKTHNKALASAASLAAGASGLVDGWDNFQAEKYKEALTYARSQGLPEPAATFFATASQMPYRSVVEMVKAEAGQDAEYNAAQAAAQRVVGDRGVEALERAALASDEQRGRYVHDALAFYRRQEALTTH